MSKLLIKSARLVDGTVTDVLIENGIITNVAVNIANGEFETLDANGLIMMTGFVDLHTHLREPGFEQSETILSGSRAAAVGGFTTVHAMANTSPVADNAGVVEQVHSLGRKYGYVDVRPVGAVTLGLEGVALSEIGAMASSRAAVRVFSDDGKCVWDSNLMRRALEYVHTFDGVIAQHAQDPKLTENAQMHEGITSSQLGLKGWPASAEESIIARDLLLANEVGAQLHVCHVSTAGSVGILRWAKARGFRVTAEVTPHHLMLTDSLAQSYNPVFKVNPPLRTETDVQAVREGLADGTIDCVATDHAPHPQESKECEWEMAAFGMIGLESALSVVQTSMVETGLLDWAGVQRVMSSNPSQIGQLESHPNGIAIGQPADLVLIDTNSKQLFDESAIRSKSHNSPFLGVELSGRVAATIHRGRITARNQTAVDSPIPDGQAQSND
ncbi:MAG: dihydroorotase [Cryobacterium sp.]|nr:dihydroorotase [Cryobacterium sp.]